MLKSSVLFILIVVTSVGIAQPNLPAVTLSPVYSIELSSQVPETSGLIFFQDGLLTHNDNSDEQLYVIDTLNGAVLQTFSLNGTSNFDWEEITQDSLYMYVGDFGNNAGNRTDLHILRIEKSSLLEGTPAIDTIAFAYEDQTDFTPSNQNTAFDCEAFIAGTDSLFLFTKNWIDLSTACYSVPKVPGNYLAQRKDSSEVNGLITGATYLPNKKLIILSGYSSLLQPFMYLLFDFEGTDFFSSFQQKINLSLNFHQIEGVATTNGIDVYLTNEYFSQSIITTQQKLHKFNLTPVLGDYLSGNNVLSESSDIRIFPNPAKDIVHIQVPKKSLCLEVRNSEGILVKKARIRQDTDLDISELPNGRYFISITDYPRVFSLIISK
ncbi:MAG: hypothetical protein RL664_646 [Bacteroidota bacterium]|jgi:hypothetical protein